MCVGTPLKVVDCDGQFAVCEADGRRERLNVMLVGQQPAGTWLLAFQGSAVRVMTEEEAMQTRAALAALDAAMNGTDDIGAYFADLAAREPTLPPHLVPRPKESTQ